MRQKEEAKGLGHKEIEALNWLRYRLNPDTGRPEVADWPEVFAFARKQALTGLFLAEDLCGVIPRSLLLQWIGQVQMIEGRNKLLNKRVEQLFGMLEDDGFQCCLLKGQGNAAMYPDPLKRCTGDIDVWLNTEEEKAYLYVKKRFPKEQESYKHIHFPVFEDASVDIHVTPLKFYSRYYQQKLQRWIGQNEVDQFGNKITLPGTSRAVSVPTRAFNAVYQLGHMLIHYFDEGLGLRQVVDYFYVLKGMEISEDKKAELAGTVKDLGLLRFARSLMWIEHSVLGLPSEKHFVEPDKSRGAALLADIMEGGNFGHHSGRYNGRGGFYHRGMVEAWRNVKILGMAPCEGSARLFSKMRTAMKYAMK